MSLRAIWIIPANSKAEVPIFFRSFPTVETRCKSRTKKLYVHIPPYKDFIKALLTEIGKLEEDIFNKERDRCSKIVTYPVIPLPTEEGILWPLIVMEKKEYIYCALPFEEKLDALHSKNLQLATMCNVSMGIEVLNGLEKYIDSKQHSLQESRGIAQLLEYVSVSLPFGRPVCSSAHVAQSMASCTLKGKAKQPAWNPEPYKGKSHVTISIKEEVRSIQFNNSDVTDNLDLCGVIQCSSEVEGVAPEISLVLTHSSENKYGLIVDPSVCNVEHITAVSSRLRFRPSKSQDLCFYKIGGTVKPPILGNFSMKVNQDIAHIHVSLQLQNTVKNSFHLLEVRIPFSCPIATIRYNSSQGSVESSSNRIVWNVGSKFPSKTLDATLRARAKLKLNIKSASEPRTREGSTSTADSDTSDASVLDDSSTTYAHISFIIADYTYSACKIDPQSIVASTVSKVQRSISSELASGVYKIRNSESDECMNASLSPEEVVALII